MSLLFHINFAAISFCGQVNPGLSNGLDSFALARPLKMHENALLYNIIAPHRQHPDAVAGHSSILHASFHRPNLSVKIPLNKNPAKVIHESIARTIWNYT